MAKNSNDGWVSLDSPGTSSEFKLLLVDDSPFVRGQIKDILGSQRVTIVEAEDGEQAWEKIQKHNDIKFMLCDINMPKLDGLGLLKRISEKMGKPSFPIVMLTTENQLDKVLTGKKYGATAWLIKPPPAQDLLKIVRKFMDSGRKAQ